MWSEILLGTSGILGGWYGLYRLGKYSAQQELIYSINMLEQNPQKNQDLIERSRKTLKELNDFTFGKTS